jgi:hypothetical protein
VDADKIQALERQIASLRKLAKDLLLAQEESLRWSSISRGVLHLGLFGTAVYCINQRKDNFKRLSRRYASAALQLQVIFLERRSIGGCAVPSLSSDSSLHLACVPTRAVQQFLSPYVGIKLVSDEFLVSLGDSLDSSLSSVSVSDDFEQISEQAVARDPSAAFSAALDTAAPHIAFHPHCSPSSFAMLLTSGGAADRSLRLLENHEYCSSLLT